MITWHRLLGHTLSYYELPTYDTIFNRLYYCSCGKEWKWSRSW